jgi:hypothetical protein
MSDKNTELSENVKETPNEKLTALAERTNNEKLAQLAELTLGEVKGVEEVQRPPVVNILLRQKMSGNDVMPPNCNVGEMYDTDSEPLGTSIEFIPVFTHAIRQKWSEGGEDGNSIDCMSLDGKTGNKYGSCETCPHGQYEKGKKLLCSRGRTFFGVTPEMTKLYKINFTKTSSKAGNQIMRMVRPPALWSKSFVIGVDKEKSATGYEYYKFSAKPSGNKVEGEVFEACDALYEHFKEQYKRALEFQKKMQEQNELVDSGQQVIEVQEGDNINFEESL